MTVEQNIAFGLKQDKLPKIASRVNEMLGFGCICRSSPNANRISFPVVSDNVYFRRSLAKRPKLLLLDEPMGALDKSCVTGCSLKWWIFWARRCDCVMVTHDQEEAMTWRGASPL